MNKSSSKLRVAVLYGGRSGEHEVSLHSAASVVKNLDKDRFEVIPVGIDKQGRWAMNNAQQLLAVSPENSLLVKIPTAEALLSPGNLVSRKHSVANGNHSEQRLFDVVFPVLHGPLGEDGTVQGLFELADIAYVGAGVLMSAIGMDKDISKRLIAAAGMRIPPYLALKRSDWQLNAKYWQKHIIDTLGLPLFIKPANLGSSVGIHKVKTAADLIPAIEDAFQYDLKIMAEKAINAREIEVAVLENIEYGQPPLVSSVGEIVPTHEFYSYEAKYIDENGAELLYPAPLDEEQVKVAQQFAQQIFTTLECEGMGRVDLFLDRDTNEFYFNEINTIPGFTQISMYPKLWQVSGLSYTDLLSHLVDLAVARHERKQQLKREWDNAC